MALINLFSSFVLVKCSTPSSRLKFRESSAFLPSHLTEAVEADRGPSQTSAFLSSHLTEAAEADRGPSLLPLASRHTVV